MARTLDEINADYSKACLDFGDCHYKIAVLTKHFQEAIQLERDKAHVLEEQLLKLNAEAAEVRDVQQ